MATKPLVSEDLGRLAAVRQAMVADKTGLLWEVILGRKVFVKYMYTGSNPPWAYRVQYRHPAGPPREEALPPAAVADVDKMVDYSVGLLQWMYWPGLSDGTPGVAGHPYRLQPCLPTVAVYADRPPPDAVLDARENVRIHLTWMGVTVGMAAVCYPIFAWWVSAAYALGGAAAVVDCCQWHHWVPINKGEATHRLPGIELDAEAGRVRYYYDNARDRREAGPSADDPLATLAADPYAWIRDRAAYRAAHSFAGL